jgi:CheY-like chemotaxis protein
MNMMEGVTRGGAGGGGGGRGYDVINNTGGVNGSSLLDSHASMTHTTEGKEYENENEKMKDKDRDRMQEREGIKEREKERMKEKMNIMRDSYSDSAHSLLMTSVRCQALQESIQDNYYHSSPSSPDHPHTSPPYHTHTSPSHNPHHSPSSPYHTHNPSSHNPHHTLTDGEHYTGQAVSLPALPLSPVYDILIVDDSALNRKMMKRYFTVCGHTCYEATDGKHAVSVVKERLSTRYGKRTFDAVLMDFVMPVMDGPTACKAIRSIGYKGLIFGVTGNYRERDVEFFVSSGADVVLSKPFDTDKFQQCMRTMFVPDNDFATTLI